jgi:hypothetical protein
MIRKVVCCHAAQDVLDIRGEKRREGFACKVQSQAFARGIVVDQL